MYQLKDQRQIVQEYCRELVFDCINFHGNVAVEDELPDQFKVSFVPASLERMLTAWHALQGETTITGAKIRDYDVQSFLQGHKVHDVRLLLTKSKPHYVRIELQCFCRISTCCFISSLELHNSWFESIG